VPELPDLDLYRSALHARIVGRALEAIRLTTPFLLRSVDPPITSAQDRRVEGLRRIGKRIVWELEDQLFLVFHLMIAGRFRWVPRGASVPRKVGLAAFDFDQGTVLLTEAGSKRRASLHLVRGEGALQAFDVGGLEVMGSDLAAFGAVLLRESHTLKRALTDPRLFSGIGNAYSDEILHAAALSPLKLTRQLTDVEIRRLFESTRKTLRDWTMRLRQETGDAFPEKVTAFREGMAVHGRFGQPCPQCGAAVQRIVYAENECNYCPSCQTGGRLLADRALSRLLREDWPRTADALESHVTHRRE
jgi:formamidopyrimidine-DNA glycosylase